MVYTVCHKVHNMRFAFELINSISLKFEATSAHSTSLSVSARNPAYSFLTDGWLTLSLTPSNLPTLSILDLWAAQSQTKSRFSKFHSSNEFGTQRTDLTLLLMNESLRWCSATCRWSATHTIEITLSALHSVYWVRLKMTPQKLNSFWSRTYLVKYRAYRGRKRSSKSVYSLIGLSSWPNG